MFFSSVKEIIRLISKGMSNICLKVTIEKNWLSQIFDFHRSVVKRPTDGTTGISSGQTDNTRGQTSTTSGQTSTRSGQTSTTNGHMGTTSG